MAIVISDETQQVVEAKMKEHGFENIDDFIQVAMKTCFSGGVFDYEELDEETRAAIDEADGQEGIAWETVREELLSKLHRRKMTNGL